MCYDLCNIHHSAACHVTPARQGPQANFQARQEGAHVKGWNRGERFSFYSSADIATVFSKAWRKDLLYDGTSRRASEERRLPKSRKSSTECKGHRRDESYYNTRSETTKPQELRVRLMQLFNYPLYFELLNMFLVVSWTYPFLSYHPSSCACIFLVSWCFQCQKFSISGGEVT